MARTASACAAEAVFLLGGIVGTPAAIAVAWALLGPLREKDLGLRGGSGCYVLVLVPVAGAASWCFWQWWRPQVWSPLEEFHSFHIQGIYMAVISTSANATLYALLVLYREWPTSQLAHVLVCLQHFTVMCGLISALHASVWLRSKAPRVWLLPLVSMLLALPFLVADRLPFSFLGFWPQVFDNAFAIVSVLLAWKTTFMAPLIIAVDLELRPKTSHTLGLSFYFGHLQQLCAALSLLYLTVCFMWTRYGHVQMLDTIYHLIWSYLRPAYVLLYFVYYLKRVPHLPWVQSFVCGVGFFFFVFFSALTETKMSQGSARVADGDSQHVSQASHVIEALLFYVSMILFYVHGVCSGNWACASERLPCCLSLVGFMVFAIVCRVVYDHLCPLPWLDAIQDHYMVWVLLHYGLGYSSILLINMALFETGQGDTVPRHRVSLTAMPADSTEFCTPQKPSIAPDKLLEGRLPNGFLC